MLNLTSSDLKLRVIGCGGDPAGFNAELTRRGGTVRSVDSIYAFDTTQIRRPVHETYETVIAQMKKNHSG